MGVKTSRMAAKVVFAHRESIKHKTIISVKFKFPKSTIRQIYGVNLSFHVHTVWNNR